MPDTVDNNELTAFIAQTLEAIGSGISGSGISQSYGPIGAEAFRMPKEVKFDIAVTAKHSAEAGGSLKIQVFGAGLDVGGKGGAEAQTVSRVQFTVPWHYESVFERLAGPSKGGETQEQNDELTND